MFSSDTCSAASLDNSDDGTLLLLLVPRGMSQFQEAYVMFHFTPSQVQLISNSG